MALVLSGDGSITGNPNITLTENVSIAGTVTYEDVTNVDSIGIVTARSGINVTGGSLDVQGNATITGIGQTALTVNGDARITGVLTVGQGSVTIGSTNITTQQINALNFPTAGALSNRNLIINGAMNVSQRGTSITGTGHFIDRFTLETSSGDTVASQLNTTAGDTPYTLGFRKHARIANTSGTTASNGFRDLRYRIEAQDIANSGWDYTSSSSYLTLSFWVRSSVAQTYSVYMRSMDGTKQRYAYTFVLSANTWTKVTQSFPGDSNITIDNDNGAGFEININPYWGPDYTASSVTNNVWQPFTTGQRVQDMTNTWATTVGATFDVTGVQLELGSNATPFEHESYGQTLAKCQRYLNTSFVGGVSVNNTSNTGVILAGGGATPTTTTFLPAASVHFPTTMRANPAVILYDLAAPRNINKCHRHTFGIAGANNQQVGVYDMSPNNFYARSDTGLSSTGLIFHYSADAEL